MIHKFHVNSEDRRGVHNTFIQRICNERNDEAMFYLEIIIIALEIR